MDADNVRPGIPPSTAVVEEMYAVLHWDKHDRVEVVATTRGLADRYVNGQWSDEFYSIEPIRVIRELPEPRPLYIMSVRVHAAPGIPDRWQVDDWNEFPGLGNGEGIPLGEVVTSVKEHAPYGWDVTATGWDRGQTESALQAGYDQALADRAARWASFAQFPLNTVVQDGQGRVMTRVRHRESSALYWDVAGGGHLYDAAVDPDALTVLAGGESR